MFLKAIDIAGFKSFARPVCLELAPGITALVGANGSGKSNVVDAVRWALGEQSMRDLRGHRAEDVIHAGPRRALGAAEVTLTFESDDAADGFPAGAAVSRRLYRSGESEYLVNRLRVRLRDVQDALRALGVDGSRNIVVNQGMTDALLTASPAERRVVLEQAAGLSGYRTRRDEARQKLSTVAENIQTIEIVLAELEPRLRSLRRQVKAVQDREEAAICLRAQLLLWYGWRWKDSTHVLDDQFNAVMSARRERQEAEQQLHRLEEQTERAAGEERAWRARLETLTAAVHSAQRESDAAGFRLRAAEQQRRATETQLEDVAERVQPLDHGAEEAAKTVRAATQTFDTLAEAEAVSRRELARAVETRRAKTDELAELQAECARCRREAITVERECSCLTEQLLGMQGDLARRKERVADLEARLGAVASTLDSLDTERSNTRIALSDAISTEEKLQEAQALARIAWQTGSKRRDRCARLRGRIGTAIVEDERRRLTAIRTVDSMAAETGRLVSDLVVGAGWEQAAAAALGPWMSLASLRCAGDGWSKEDGDLIRAWRGRLVIAPGRWADEMITGMPMDAIDPLIGTVMVDDLDTARRIWRQIADEPAWRIAAPPVQIVTRAGVVVSALGLESGRQDSRTVRFLEAKRTARALRHRLDQLRRRQMALDKTSGAAAVLSQELQTKLEVAQKCASDAAEHRRDISGALDSLERRRAHVLADQTRWLEARGSLLSETARIQTQMRDAAVRHERHRHDLQQHQAALTRAEEQLQLRVEESRAADKTAAEARHDLEMVAARVAAQRALCSSAEQTAERLRQEKSAMTTRISSLEEERKRWWNELELLSSASHDLGQVLAEQRVSLEQVRSLAPPPPPELRALEELRRQLTQCVGVQESTMAQLHQMQRQQQQLALDIERDLGLAPNVLPGDVDSPPAEDDIRRLRQRASQYAEVGDSVIAERAEIEARYQSLKSHVEDLSAASTELQGIMSVADREMHSRFDVAFSDVNQEFGRVFEVMLRGGYARLEVVDEEGGISISAQLPGKRAHSSAAFSGGERALVASSLLFGILRIRPTPFCVLDEVDAALDEGNVDRYLDALRDISRRTQIIVVTHNRATMAAAKVLYGVTMDTEGVSSLLSLRLDAFTAAV